MLGPEVIGGIAAIIGILDASIKIYNDARKDFKLHEAFKSVGDRLPVILNTLQICQENLEPRKGSLPEDVCDALKHILDSCKEKGRKLEVIFKDVIPGEADTLKKRYTKFIRSLGKGNKVEELMTALTEDVQLVVNHNAVKSATQEQNAELENILEEMKSIDTSDLYEEHAALSFDSGGGAQTNNVNSGRGQQINNNGRVRTQNLHYGKE